MKLKQLLVLLSVAVFYSAPKAQAQANLSAQYQSLWDSDTGALKSEEIIKLRAYKILLVPGFLSNITMSLADTPAGRLRAGEYFNEQIAWLKENGIEVEKVPLASEESPSFNAGAIANAVVSTSKPVILISHSKGGLDTLVALLSYPEIQSRVKGWISLQSPFRGSPVADYVRSHPLLSALGARVFEASGGSSEGLNSLSESVTSNYLAQSADQIASLNARVKIISFATYKKNVPWRIDSLLETTRNWMEKRGQLNDGLVPLSSAVLPGSEFVTIEGVDHADPVMWTPFTTYDRMRMTRTLVQLLSKRLEAPTP